MNIGKKDVMWGYISLFLVNGVNILLLPLILKYLSASELGLWYTFTTLYNLAILIDFGLQSTVTRNISYIWSGATEIKAQGIQENISQDINIDFFLKVTSTIKNIYFVMAAIILFVLLVPGTFYILSVTKNEIPVYTSLFSYYVYIISIILNIGFSYWNSLLRGTGAIRYYNQSLIITKISQIVFSGLFLYLGYGIIGVSFAYTLSVIVNRVLQSKLFYNYSKENLKGKRKIKLEFNKDIFKKLIPNTLRSGLLSISNFLIVNLPILLSSYYLSLEISGRFGFINQIITLILSLSNSYFNTYLTQMNYLRARNNNREAAKLFKKSILTITSLSLFLWISFMLFGEKILEIFKIEFQFLSISVLILIFLYRFLYNNQLIFTSFISTKNELPHVKAFIVSAVVTVCIQIILLEKINRDVYAIILPILVVQLLFNNWYWILYTIRDYRRDINHEKNFNDE